MPEIIESNTLGDAIRWEHEGDYSRKKVTVITGQNLAILTVFAIITASGKATILAPAGADGSEVAAGIMVGACDATSADKEGAGIVRDAMIDPDNLVWPDGIIAGEKTQALVELDALGIVAVETA